MKSTKRVKLHPNLTHPRWVNLMCNSTEPRELVTDKFRSYGVAHREFMPDAIHNTQQYANNRAELSHQPT